MTIQYSFRGLDRRTMVDPGDPRFRLDLLSAPVGDGGHNDRLDVAKVESLLGAHGYLDLAKTEGPTGYAGVRLTDAVKRFQKDNDLKVDGRLNPGGETIGALVRAANAVPPPKNSSEVDPRTRRPSQIWPDSVRRPAPPPAPGYAPDARGVFPDGQKLQFPDRKTGTYRPPTQEEYESVKDIMQPPPKPGVLERAVIEIIRFLKPQELFGPVPEDGKGAAPGGPR